MENLGLSNTILETINHLITNHLEFAATIELLAANAQGKKITPNIDKNRRYFGLNNLDQKLEKYLNFENGFFVELGANDGVDQSNTLHFELFKNWRGVLIEPTPHNFFNCLKNRAAENSFFCNACVSFDFKEKFVEIAFSNLMSTPIGLESDISNPLEHAQAGKKYLNPTDEIFIFGALAKSLNEILTKSSAPNNIDLLSLDVEGAELEVLKGIDHNMYRFKYMCVESHFNPEKIRDYLQDKNYSFVEKLSSFDYLFVDNSN